MQKYFALHRYQNPVIISLFLLLAAMFIVSIPHRKVHIDDAWLGEHSYWLWKDGTTKSKLMTGIAESEKRLVLHHKLFTIQGAALFAVFGFSLQWLKSISFIYLILSV
ncbi:MAG: hypothetical protein Q8T08_25095, partial [Ignavibacteria bacterium]|nr:hypothetical protein [Ignavibacteria bacterium]